MGLVRIGGHLREGRYVRESWRRVSPGRGVYSTTIRRTATAASLQPGSPYRAESYLTLYSRGRPYVQARHFGVGAAMRERTYARVTGASIGRFTRLAQRSR